METSIVACESQAQRVHGTSFDLLKPVNINVLSHVNDHEYRLYRVYFDKVINHPRNTQHASRIVIFKYDTTYIFDLL